MKGSSNHLENKSIINNITDGRYGVYILISLLSAAMIFGILVGVVLVSSAWVRADMDKLMTKLALIEMAEKEQSVILVREGLLKSGDIWYNPIKNVTEAKKRLEKYRGSQ